MSIFDKGTGLKPRRSRFNLSYAKAYDADMGQLIPSCVRYLVPGDIVNLRQEIVVRPKGPLLSPAFAEINVHSYAFFVPLRILLGTETEDAKGWLEYDIDDHYFEKFITGGREGNLTLQLPAWQPASNVNVVNDNWNGIPAGSSGSNAGDPNVTVAENGLYSLWDYLEYPLGWSNTDGTQTDPSDVRILDFKRRAYAMIWNEWFRNQNVMPPVSVLSNEKVLNCCWKMDYFTSMLPWQQRGQLPNVPVTGSAPVLMSSSVATPSKGHLNLVNNVLGFTNQNGNNYDYAGQSVGSSPVIYPFFANLTASNNIGFDINQLRLAFQIQRWQELNARCGSRYVEFLKGNFGCSPTDDTLQRPMFIGGSKSPVIISEVLQTAADGNEGVGSLAGHSIAADSNKLTKFRANEYGILMVLTTIKPKAMYSQGFDKEDTYDNRYQFYNPAFVNLSEDAVLGCQIYATGEKSDDDQVIGYQGRYNELRTSHDKVCGALRAGQNLSYWVAQRNFGSLPQLNGQFLKCNPNKDLFSVKDEPAWIVMVNNKLTAFRPMPYQAVPGLIDHLYGERR